MNFENDQSISFKVIFPANIKNVVSRKTRSKYRKQKTGINKWLLLVRIASVRIQISL